MGLREVRHAYDVWINITDVVKLCVVQAVTLFEGSMALTETLSDHHTREVWL